MAISYSNLTTANSEMFSVLTYKHYKKQLTELKKTAAIGAVIGGFIPAGLVLISLPEKKDYPAKILSLFISENSRRQGIGRELLQRAQETIKELGYTKMRIVFSKNRTGDLGQLLASKEWKEPIDNFFIYNVCVKDVLEQSSWIRNDYIRPEFEIFPWAELRDDERIKLCADKEKKECEWAGFQPPINPEEKFELINSLGIRSKNGLAGWITYQENNKMTKACSLLYVMKKYRRSTLAIGLIIESFCLQVDAGIPNVSCIIKTENLPMLNLYRKRFDFATISVSQTMISEKEFEQHELYNR